MVSTYYSLQGFSNTVQIFALILSTIGAFWTIVKKLWDLTDR